MCFSNCNYANSSTTLTNFFVQFCIPITMRNVDLGQSRDGGAELHYFNNILIHLVSLACAHPRGKMTAQKVVPTEKF